METTTRGRELGFDWSSLSVDHHVIQSPESKPAGQTGHFNGDTE